MGRMSDTIGNYNFTLKNRRLICFILDLKKRRILRQIKSVSHFLQNSAKSLHLHGKKMVNVHNMNVLYVDDYILREND